MKSLLYLSSRNVHRSMHATHFTCYSDAFDICIFDHTLVCEGNLFTSSAATSHPIGQIGLNLSAPPPPTITKSKSITAGLARPLPKWVCQKPPFFNKLICLLQSDPKNIPIEILAMQMATCQNNSGAQDPSFSMNLVHLKNSLN